MGFQRWRDGTLYRWDKEMAGENSPGPFYFLGLMHGHWERDQPESDALLTDAPGESVHTGIGVVVPADAILNMLKPGLDVQAEKVRKHLDEQKAPKPDTPTPDAPELAEGVDGGEFDRFEDLTQKLTQVPKSEIDEKRREH